MSVDDAKGGDRLAVTRLERIDDRQVQSAGERGREKARVENGTRRQTKAHVGDAEHAAHAEPFPARAHGGENLGDFGLVGGGGHDEAVDRDVLAAQAGVERGVDDAPGNRDALLGVRGNAVLVEGEPHDRGAMARGDG